MSTYEYYDMFIERQDKGNYHMFVFDIKDSKKMDKEKRKNASIQMQQLMHKIYNEIKEIERLSKTKILITNIDGIVPYEERNKVMNKFGMLFEPFLFADTFGFTIYKNTLSKETILSIYEKYKQELNITFDFHIADAYYETNKWEEGNKYFFRGYCIDILSNYHKEYNKILRKKKTKNHYKTTIDKY